MLILELKGLSAERKPLNFLLGVALLRRHGPHEVRKNLLKYYVYDLQRKQSDPHSLLTKVERSFCLISFLK